MRELVCPKHMCKTPLGKCMEWDIDEFTGEKVQCTEKPVMSTTLYWCKECNVPIYEECCPVCGEKGEYVPQVRLLGEQDVCGCISWQAKRA